MQRALAAAARRVAVRYYGVGDHRRVLATGQRRSVVALKRALERRASGVSRVEIAGVDGRGRVLLAVFGQVEAQQLADEIMRLSPKGVFSR